MCFSFIFRLFVKMNLKFLKMNVWRWIFMGVLLLGTSLSLQAQSYERKWKKVEELEKKDLPKSVIEEAKTIYLKAEKEKNVPQMMKAFLTMTVYREIVSPDSLQVDIKKLEAWASSPKTSVQERAVLFSILGEMVIRKDFEKGDSCLKQSLKDSMALIKYDAGKFVPLVKVGETSRRYFNDNLYELLARRAIQLWKQNLWQRSEHEIDESIAQAYQSLLSIYREKGNRSAWLLTALDAYPNADESQLRKWIEEYKDLDVCAEVYLSLSKLLYRKNKSVESVESLREGIARYPNYERVNALKNEEKYILRPELWVNVDDACPNDSVTLKVTYRNLTKFSVYLYKINLPVESPLLKKITEDNVTQYGTFFRKESFLLEPTLDYNTKLVELKMKTPAVGIYYAVMKPVDKEGNGSTSLLYLTGLQMIQRSWNNQCEFIVLDKRTGHPVPNAKLSFYDRKNGEYVLEKTFTADEYGTVSMLPDEKIGVFCQAYTEEDKAMDICYSNTRSGSYQDAGILEGDVEENIRLFIDRGIYRPDQRIYYSGIVYKQRQDIARVVECSSYTAKLMDYNFQVVDEQEVKTDSLGTFSGEFLLPASLLPGNYYIWVKNERISLRVEEYKRPTFEVSLDSLKSSYQLGDSVNMMGLARTFSGTPVPHANVKYRIDGMEGVYWRGHINKFHTVSGETTTDAEGRFVIPVCFFADKKQGDSELNPLYEITAEVTSMAGETHSATMRFPVGKIGLDVSLDSWKDKVIVKEEKQALRFSVVNSLGVDVRENVHYQVFRQIKGEKDVCVLDENMVSNTGIVPERIYALPSGKYLLKASVEKDGGKATLECPFTLFSLADRKLPYETDMWSYQDGKVFDNEKPVSIYWGSSMENVYLLYDIFSGDKRLESKRINFSDSLFVFRFPYKKEYGDGIRICFAFVKDGRLYKKEFQILKPEPEKKLELTWKTFRDKLIPGQKETWTLNIRYPDGTPANAQLMASMYDASLDQFVSHHWNLKLHYNRNTPFIVWKTIGNRFYFWDGSFLFKRLECKELDYSVLNIPVVGMRKYKEMGIFTSMDSGSANMRNQVLYKGASPTFISMEDEVVEVETAMSLEQQPKTQLRSNFAETAFFYPRLRSNGQGEVNLEFTLPESLTQWKFMGLAHTKDMDYGQLNATVTASKDFMLQPNLPRFVRVGDDVTLMASLINLTQKKIKGTVRMELFNPETDEVVCVRKKAFKVDAEETNAVSFSFTVKEEFNVLACRMIAEGNGFSDGEQCYLPVLTNKKWITESVSLDVDTAGTYLFSLEKLFNHHSKTVTMPRMVVEFTGNPLWYAIQALPVLSEPENENVYSWAVAFYANTLAEHIVQVNPVIRQVVGSWKAKGDDVLQSALQKNEELKNVMLEETPWLKDALNDSEQKKLLVALFDENTMNYRSLSVIRKLKELQQENGSWSWFKGMPGNRYMTTQITELLARLESVTGKVVANKDMASLYRKAFGYLKNEVQEEYERMCEAERKGNQSVYPSKQALRYLYICALDESLQPDKQVNDYLVDKLENMSSILSIYGKSTAAIVLKHYGRTNKAGEFLQSVMEYSVMTPLLGRYFDSPKAEYSWFSYKIPTQVMAMEAVRCVANEEKTQEEMKRWLLRQKQTQCWETPIATVDAIYALLSTGKDWLDNDASADLVVGKEKWQVPEDALGYVKQQVEGDVVNIKDITVRKKTDGIAWGSVYAQFLEVMDNVSSQSNSLSVLRELYKDKNKVSTDELNIGDRITVRLTVTSGRDMDFVQLKDERAACMEPIDVLSAYHWQNGFGYYQVTKDASTSFFFDRLRKGTHILEYDVYVMSSGEYQEGVATVQSMYAPEYIGHSDAIKLKVK